MSGVVLYGWYGAGNVGDEAVLAALVQMLRDRQPDLPITALSVNPQQTMQLHSIAAVRRSPRSAYAAIRACDTFVLGGGGTVQDVTSVWNLPSFLAYPLLAKRIGKRVVWSGVGVGPLGTRLGRQLAARAASRTDAITVRDEPSTALLRHLLPRSVTPLLVTADPALALRPIPRAEAMKVLADSGVYIHDDHVGAGGGPPNAANSALSPQSSALVVFAIRRPLDPQLGTRLRLSYLLPVSLRERFGRWSAAAERLYQQTVAHLAQLADYCVANWGARVLFVPFDPVDCKVAAAIIAQMQRPDCATMLQGEHPPATVMGIVGLADAVIAMRLHALIFGAAMGKPLLALSYDDKVRNFMHRLGLDNYTAPVTQADALINKAAQLWPQRNALAAQVVIRAAELRERANLNADIIIGQAGQQGE